MLMPFRTTLTVLSAAVLLAGCGTVAKVSKEIDEDQAAKKAIFNTPVQLKTQTRVVEVRGTFLPVTPMSSLEDGEWLRQKKVSLEIKNPTPLSSVITKFAEQGLNIATDLPLSSFTYVGKVNQTDAETALRAVLGSVGLDYQVDDKRQLVVIKPISSRSWYLNIGNRRSSFSSDNQNSTNGGNNSGSGNTGNSNPSTGSGSSGGSNGLMGGSSGSPGGSTGGFGNQNNSGGNNSNSGGGNNNDNGTGVTSADDFWPSLSRELESRLSILMPNAGNIGQGSTMAMPSSMLPPIPPYPGAMPPPTPISSAGPMGMAASQEMYSSRRIGSYSLNPETGAISIQAPHWVLSEMDVYLKGVQEMYNTDISFKGEVVLVTTSRGDSEGFDLTAFAQWAGGKYGAVISNTANALGGITLSMPTNGSPGSIQAGNQTVGGPLAGMTYRGTNNALNIFNAYLSQLGKVSVIQRPMLTTTSGVPGIFSKKQTDYYNTISQQAAAGGTGSAATATQNQIVALELGTELRINPRVDISTGLIRAQISLNQQIRSGTKIVPQTITFGNTAQTVNTEIPLITKQNISGEVLLRDGDLIVVGGQTEGNLSADESGIPGGDRGPLGGFLGTKQATRGAQTYYFALRVSVTKRQ